MSLWARDSDGDLLTTEEEYAYNANPGDFTGSLGASGFSGLPALLANGASGYDVHLVMRNDSSLSYQPQTSQDLIDFVDYLGALTSVRADGDYSVMSFPLTAIPFDFGRVEITPLSGFSIDLP